MLSYLPVFQNEKFLQGKDVPSAELTRIITKMFSYMEMYDIKRHGKSLWSVLICL